MASLAQAQFEVENQIQTLPPDDAIFQYDAAEAKRLNQDSPWRRDPRFFKRARISAPALVKMVTHARSGGAIEVMGLMQGKVTSSGDIIVLDAFALPVEGTETRVNANAEAYEYMIQYGESSKQVKRLENVVGWYHSHPGYGCWLSGIDVGTQKQNQSFQDPWLAVVIDPNRTVSAGKVDIGAFRTFPEGYAAQRATEEAAAETSTRTATTAGASSVPLSKVEDFGVHANEYYQLDVDHFKSTLDAKLLDALWGKYWIASLAQNALATNRSYTAERLEDVDAKLKRLGRQSASGGLAGFAGLASSLGLHSSGGRPPGGGGRRAGGGGQGKGKQQALPPPASASQESIEDDTITGNANDRSGGGGNTAQKQKREPTELERLGRDLDTIVNEQRLGLLTQEVKAQLFRIPHSPPPAASIPS